jgi:hypothetical protein
MVRSGTSTVRVRPGPAGWNATPSAPANARSIARVLTKARAAKATRVTPVTAAVRSPNVPVTVGAARRTGPPTMNVAAPAGHSAGTTTVSRGTTTCLTAAAPRAEPDPTSADPGRRHVLMDRPARTGVRPVPTRTKAVRRPALTAMTPVRRPARSGAKWRPRRITSPRPRRRKPTFPACAITSTAALNRSTTQPRSCAARAA